MKIRYDRLNEDFTETNKEVDILRVKNAELEDLNKELMRYKEFQSKL